MQTTDAKLWDLFDESKQPGKTPLYSEVPKDFDENLAYRAYVLEEIARDDDAAHDYWIAGKRDILFWINTFAWTYDPRLNAEGKNPAVPFITYPFQDDAILKIQDCVGKRDLVFEKSRDQGASVMFLTVYDHFFWYGDMLDFLMVSRNKDYVDKAGFKKSLFWKIDFIHEHLPGKIFLKSPKYLYRKELHIQNLINGTTISGEATTGDAARGDRKTSIFIDELAAFDLADGYAVQASTQFATNSRLVNSTYKGTDDAFYDLCKKSENKLRLHWTQHPVQNKGLYCYKNGNLTIYDTKYQYPEDYEFIQDSKLRSPYYDLECKRSAHASQIASELDINPEGSASQFFEMAVLEEIEREFVQKPALVGELDFTADDGEPDEFIIQDDGRLKLWMRLDERGCPQRDRKYAIGADIATGGNAVQSSNSVLAIIDTTTGEKVGEWASPTVMPHEFAAITVAICKWFNDAFLIWEDNGPGKIFGRTVVKLGYKKFYFRRSETNLKRKVTETPGWYSTTETKQILLGNFRSALSNKEYIERSSLVIDECKSYIHKPDGSIIHSSSQKTIDPSGANANHGDRVIATALAKMGCDEQHKPTPEKQKIPQHCAASRDKANEEERRMANRWRPWKRRRAA